MKSNEVKNYYPLKFASSRDQPFKEPVPSHPLAHKPDYHNRTDNTTSITAHFKRCTVPPPSGRPDSASKAQNTQERPSSRSIHDDYQLILENMEKRTKELMREAAGLMTMLLQQPNSLQVDEKIQEKLRLTEDREIEREYKALKDRLASARRQSIIQGTLTKKYNPYFTVPNPEAVQDKTKKLQRQRVLDFRVDPTDAAFRPGSRRDSVSKQGERSSLSR